MIDDSSAFSTELEALRRVYECIREARCGDSKLRSIHEARNSIRDVLHCSELISFLLEKVQEGAQRDVTRHDQPREPNASPSQGSRTIDWIDRSVMQVKALFYFMRSFQDASYRFLLVATGQQAGNHSSMSDILSTSNGNPVRDLLMTEISGFVNWFEDIRQKRNNIKLGTPVGGFAAVSRGHSVVKISFLKAPKDKQSVEEIHLVQAIYMTRKLGQLLLSYGLAAGLIGAPDS